MFDGYPYRKDKKSNDNKIPGNILGDDSNVICDGGQPRGEHQALSAYTNSYALCTTTRVQRLSILVYCAYCILLVLSTRQRTQERCCAPAVTGSTAGQTWTNSLNRKLAAAQWKQTYLVVSETSDICGDLVLSNTKQIMLSCNVIWVLRQ